VILVNSKREQITLTLSRSLSHFVLYRTYFSCDFPFRGIFAATVGCGSFMNPTAKPLLYAMGLAPVMSFIAAVHRTCAQLWPDTS
jgi:hypothetical protein